VVLKWRTMAAETPANKVELSPIYFDVYKSVSVCQCTCDCHYLSSPFGCWALTCVWTMTSILSLGYERQRATDQKPNTKAWLPLDHFCSRALPWQAHIFKTGLKHHVEGRKRRERRAARQKKMPGLCAFQPGLPYHRFINQLFR
jgi:hypothetical protein